MMTHKTYIWLTLALILFGCNSTTNKQKQNLGEKPLKSYSPVYADLFSIEYYTNYKKLIVAHPWIPGGKPIEVILSDDKDFLKSNPEAIKVPVERWISVASTQISYAEKLNVVNKVVGMAEPEYISNTEIKKGIKSGKIINIGSAYAPNTEQILSLNADIMMIAPFKEDFYASLRNAGVKMVTNCSYLENLPLGRVEWLVFVAAFFNKELEAITIVNNISERYNKVKKLALEVKNKPSVFTGTIYQGTWFSPSAESYNANFLRDAGTNYIFSDRKSSSGSLQYDFETVYNAAHNCDYWMLSVNYNGNFSYSALKDRDVRYADFDAFKNRKIIYSNSNTSQLYERGLLEPDLILSDLVKYFHPELLIDYKPTYYYPLTKE